MKKYLLIIVASLFIFEGNVSAQTVVAGISPANLSCGGGNVNLTALGNSTTPVFGDDFNTGGVAPGWSATASAQFNNPCGASVDGSTYLWMGSSTSAPREMTTAPVDVSCGGTVCFDFKFMPEGFGTQSAPCEGADLYNEGVSLQYSVNGGATWIDFAYFAPNGDLLTSYPSGVTSPYASGATNFTTWQNYCFTIPAGAFSPTTQFQLHQWGASGSSYDHWGIDNFYVYADPCAPYYYDWDFLPGAPDAPDVTTNVTQTTTFEVCYTNGINSVCDQVTVVVASIDITALNFVTEPCLGDDAATLSVSVTGGAGPFTYSLNGPTTASNGSGNFNGLAPGFYTMTINDAGSCQVDSSFTIPPGPACCTVTATSVNALCFGQASGTATANPANGVAPYTYQWFDAGMTAIGQTTQTATGLAVGTYNVTITDFNGCTSTVAIAVGEPTAMNANSTPTMVSCFAACDGSISVAAPSGGTPGYVFNINGGAFAASSNFPNLCAGNYNVIAQDNNGCQVVMNAINITEPTDLTLTETANTPATCGGTNGSFTVVEGGGTAGFTFDIGGASQGSGTFTGLAAGNYTVTVTDGNTCTEQLVVVISNSAGPAPFVDILNDATCAGGLNGSVTIGVGGGTAPYQFSLDGGANQGSNSFTNIGSGPHTVTVTDFNGCSGNIPFNVSQPSALTFSTVITDATCNGVCDGQIDITANNATPPYTYSDDNGITFQASNILTGICAGNVNVVVQDNNGCLTNSLEIMNEPTAVTSVQGFVDPLCYQTPTGEISFVPAGGTPGYSFSVDNGATFSGSSPITGLMAGVYDVVVQDNNGCLFNDQVTVTDPPPFTFTYIANNPSNCGASDGSFEIIATAGLAPYIYSIDGGATTQFNNGSFTGQFSGLYTLIVTDANGCVDSVFEALSDNIMTTATDMTVDVTCYNGSDGAALVSQQFGAPPFNYTINTSFFSQGSGLFNGLSAGVYYVTIQDAGLCIGIEQFEIFEPDSLTFSPALTDITCPAGADGVIDFGAVAGGDNGPYTYSINNGVSFQAGTSFTGLTIGTYDLVAMDGNGCLGAMQIDLTEPSPFTAVINETDLTCNANNTGFVQVIGGGSTSPYTYTMVGTNGSGVFAGLAANNYNITITDVNGCTFDTTQVVGEPAILVANYIVTDALCFSSADGEVDVTAGGGTTPYVYSSDGGVITQSGNVLLGLSAGNYNIYVQDANGCNISSNQVVNEPTLLTMTMLMNPATCGLNNADVTITANNGTPTYMYSIDNGANFQAGTSFNGLAPTNYTVVLQDFNGCEIDSIISLSADVLPVIDNIVAVDPLCNGSVDGTITVTSSGGIGAHQYSNDNGGTFQASNIFTGLPSGPYTVVVQDANGCMSNVVVNLTDPALLTYASVPTDLLCNGDFTGAIDITENGGTAPYTYSIDNGVSSQGGGSFGFIAAGTYDIIVADFNNCTAIGQEIVNEPAVLSWTAFNIIDPTCYLFCDGTVNTTVGGGTAPYTYNWAGGIVDPGNPANASAICDGSYSVTVTDGNACQLDSLNFVLTQPSAVVINSVTSTDLLCYQDATGSINVDAPTGAQYSIDGGTTFQAGNLFPGLQIGNYDIVVLDPAGCIAVSNTSVYEPDSLYSIAPSDWFGCFGADVNVQAFTNGGTVPYATYTWTNNLNATVENNAIFTYANNLTAPGIQYTLVVTDANGCQTVPVSFNITAQEPLAVTASLDTTICLGGTADLSVTATGGELIDFGTYLGYSYSWDTGVVGDTLQSVSVSPGAPTLYTVTVTDLCGQIEQDQVQVDIFADPVADITGGGNGCVPDSLSFFNTSYVVGSSLLWDFGDGNSSTGIGTVQNLYTTTGCFDVSLTVTSAEGCVSSQTYTDLVCINELPVAGFTWEPWSPSILDPTIEITDLSFGGSSYSYTFLNENGGSYGTINGQNPSFTFPVDEETTSLVCQVVTSPEGCIDSTCQLVQIQEEILFYVPNVFTPDGDPYNQNFQPIFTSGVDPFDFHLTIFNRWGEVIFESYNYDVGWNGQYGNGGLVDDGVYIWQIEFGEKLTDKKQKHRGHVTVLK